MPVTKIPKSSSMTRPALARLEPRKQDDLADDVSRLSIRKVTGETSPQSAYKLVGRKPLGVTKASDNTKLPTRKSIPSASNTKKLESPRLPNPATSQSRKISSPNGEKSPSSGESSGLRKTGPSSAKKPATAAPKASSPIQKPLVPSLNRARLSSSRDESSTTNSVTTTGMATRALRPSSVQKEIKKPPPTDPDMAQCPICGRNFNKERIQKHNEICKKAANRKKKVFDVKQGKLIDLREAEMLRERMERSTVKTTKAPQTNWRKTHEEFIQTIAAARAATRHLKAGGKLSDLPPPPPADTSHYTQCPHCNRKFEPSVAERHIPKCATIKSRSPIKPVKKSKK